MPLKRLALTACIALALSACGSNPDTTRGTGQMSSSSANQTAAVAADYEDALQRIYVAYFGRPADPAGLAYWAEQYRIAGMPVKLADLSQAYAGNPGVRAMIDVFGASQESRDLYPGDNDAFITAIYRNILSREPDAAGKAYWIDTLNSGAMTRAIAAVTIMAGARTTDITIIDKKVSAAAAFTRGLDTPARLKTYDGLAANVRARNLLAQVTLNTDLNAFAGAIAATITELAADDQANQYDWFLYDMQSWSKTRIGLLAPGASKPTAAFGGAMVEVRDWIPAATMSSEMASNVHFDSLTIWTNGRLMRQNLISTGAVLASSQLSSLNQADQCASPSYPVTPTAIDLATPSRSWLFLTRPGADQKCANADDTFVAVRLDMGPNDAPRNMSEPVGVVRAEDGSLSAVLVREGSTIKRLDRDLANPVTLFTLPGPDLDYQSDLVDQQETFIFESGKAIYAWNTALTAPAKPVLVSRLESGENYGGQMPGKRGEIFLAIENRAAQSTRVVRYTTATDITESAGTVTGIGTSGTYMWLTPTRLVFSAKSSAMVASIPRSGGAQQWLVNAGDFSSSTRVDVVGEKVWIGTFAPAVFSINSDGTGAHNLANTWRIGCIAEPRVPSFSQASTCAEMLVVENGSLRSYDVQTNKLRTIYGDIPMPSKTDSFQLDDFFSVGQQVIVTQQIRTDTPVSAYTTINYLIQSGKPGLTRLSVP